MLIIRYLLVLPCLTNFRKIYSDICIVIDKWWWSINMILQVKIGVAFFIFCTDCVLYWSLKEWLRSGQLLIEVIWYAFPCFLKTAALFYLMIWILLNGCSLILVMNAYLISLVVIGLRWGDSWYRSGLYWIFSNILAWNFDWLIDRLGHTSLSDGARCRWHITTYLFVALLTYTAYERTRWISNITDTVLLRLLILGRQWGIESRLKRWVRLRGWLSCLAFQYLVNFIHLSF